MNLAQFHTRFHTQFHLALSSLYISVQKLVAQDLAEGEMQVGCSTVWLSASGYSGLSLVFSFAQEPLIQWIFCSRSKLPFEVLTIMYYRNYLEEGGGTSCFKCSKLRVQYLYHHAALANPCKKQAISPETDTLSL